MKYKAELPDGFTFEADKEGTVRVVSQKNGKSTLKVPSHGNMYIILEDGDIVPRLISADLRKMNRLIDIGFIREI
jgi:hypothetical protein